MSAGQKDLAEASAEFGEYFLDRAVDHLRYHDVELKGADLMNAAIRLAGLFASIHQGCIASAKDDDTRAGLIAAIARLRAEREDDDALDG